MSACTTELELIESESADKSNILETDFNKISDRASSLRAIERALQRVPLLYHFLSHPLAELTTLLRFNGVDDGPENDIAALSSLRLGHCDLEAIVKRVRLICACCYYAREFSKFEKRIGFIPKTDQVLHGVQSGGHVSVQKIGKHLARFLHEHLPPVKRQAKSLSLHSQAVRLGIKLQVLNRLGEQLGLTRTCLSLALGFDCAALNRLTYSSLRYINSGMVEHSDAYSIILDLDKKFGGRWAFLQDQYAAEISAQGLQDLYAAESFFQQSQATGFKNSAEARAGVEEQVRPTSDREMPCYKAMGKDIARKHNGWVDSSAGPDDDCLEADVSSNSTMTHLTNGNQSYHDTPITDSRPAPWHPESEVLSQLSTKRTQPQDCCDRAFSSLGNHHRHSRKRHGPYGFYCSAGGASFKRRSGGSEHNRNGCQEQMMKRSSTPIIHDFHYFDPWPLKGTGIDVEDPRGGNPSASVTDQVADDAPRDLSMAGSMVCAEGGQFILQRGTEDTHDEAEIGFLSQLCSMHCLIEDSA